MKARRPAGRASDDTAIYPRTEREPRGDGKRIFTRRDLVSPARVATMNAVKKVFWQIVRLLWKVLKIYFWKWLRPYLGKILLGVVVFFGVAVALLVLFASRC